ncbi:hypothetical protein FDK12_06350 [Arthrobacter sp. NamB2]|uniref:hypothetical protein n=1 Tax=Arthrobacter sp. NamB2 TaxID=2576035 RepID=UPI0010C9E4E3|nr:hypothetical protein [Arthrobacter sp. NamB2]TKV29253.1 hypothetical protein FDK12_06350 [Arthrobacter sp. NamB2]
MATTDKKFTATEESTSKHPHDWGRAMAVAICRLTDMAREAGDTVHHEALIGEDLHLFVEDTEHGVNITMSWTPREQGALTDGSDQEGSEPDKGGLSHSAAGQRFDPTGGSTAGVGQ